MPSVQQSIIDELITTLRGAGFRVFNGIKGHHTGRRPATRSYIEVAHGFIRQSNNITAGCISGPSTLRLKYYQHKQWITNTDNQRQSLLDYLQLMEKAFSQVWVPGMQTKFDCNQPEPVGGNNIGYTTNYELQVVLATLQDRGEIQADSFPYTFPITLS
jgi:hypothetical protein